MMTIHSRWYLVLLFLLLGQSTTAFLSRLSISKDLLQNEDAFYHSGAQQSAQKMFLSMSRSEEDDVAATQLDVVLFGIGDMRSDDHEGLSRALIEGSKKVLPLMILDDATISKIPGVVSHTIDTSKMVVAAVADLQKSLKEKLDLDLQIVTGTNLADSLMQVIQQYADNNTMTRVHVHDLGDADNAMGYGTYSQLKANTLPNAEIVPWTGHLRSKPWIDVESLPDRYPEFQDRYCAKESPLTPVAIEKDVRQSIEKLNIAKDAMAVPTAGELVDRIQATLSLDPAMVKGEVNTGIFQSHWGGLDAGTVAESQVLQQLKIFVDDCKEEDELWTNHPSYVAMECPRNERSLEHATFNWMARESSAKNLLAGEPMTRYLSAPLLLGTVSARRLWHISARGRPFFVSPLKTLVEGREWHHLLAAKNIRTRPEYQPATAGSDEATMNGKTRYGYWRWHGYLCRYAQTPLASPETTTPGRDKEGLLLFHGFGASCTQWNKVMSELSSILSEKKASDETAMEGLAPDLLGFGQSEKPPISYSIYVWDSQCSDFVKEVAVSRQGWSSYVVGGNSIGGFSAASTAANECARDDTSVCSSGATGTGLCRGLVLMNPAGPIQSREEVEMIEKAVDGDQSKLLTVAEVAASNALPPCNPLPRPVARFFGNVLLSYLRPRIQTICVNLYPTNPSAVNDDLCDTIERDSVDPGGVAVMISGTKLPPPRSMNEMLRADFGGALSGSAIQEASFGGPVLVATGVLDPLNDAKGRSEGLAALREGIEFDPIKAGHCPHDELPKDVAMSLARWMSTTIKPRNVAASSIKGASVAN